MEADSLLQILPGSFLNEGTAVAIIWVLVILFLSLGGFVSYCEFVYIAANEKKHKGDSYSASIQLEFSFPEFQKTQHLLLVFVSSRLIYNSISVIFLMFLLSPYFNQSDLTVAFWILAVLVITPVFYIINHVIPKRLASRKRRNYSKISRYVSMATFVSKPIVALFDAAFLAQEKLLPGRSPVLSIDELSKTLDLTNEEFDEGKDLLEGVVNFSDKSAVEIMTPREDMACLDISVSFAEIKQYVIEMHYSRIPIYDKSEDYIRGILYVKDLLPVLDKNTHYHWQQLIRPAFFVPESKKIDALLKEFRSNKIHLAIVVDEYGGTSGLVTMEDVLEEIVGEISDEYDEEKKSFVELPDGSLIFEGKTLLTDFFRAVDVDDSDFEELTEDVDTLAGLLLELKGDFPRRQEIVTYKNYQFQVLEMNKRRIVKVKFTILDKEVAEE